MRRIWILLFGILFAQQAAAEVPSTLHFTGVLMSSEGIVVHCPDPLLCSTPASVTVAFYAEPGGGTPLYTEVHEVVFVDQGTFELSIGIFSPLALEDFKDPLFLGVSVNGDSEAIPRLEVMPVPSALVAKNAENAEKLGGLSPEEFALSLNETALVGGVHTSLDCEADGGIVTPIGSGETLCKFVADSCPSGWSQVNNWTATVSTSCTQVVFGDAGECPPPFTCIAFGHPFADLQPQSCCIANVCGISDISGGCFSPQACGVGPLSTCCEAAVIEVGCQ